MSQTERLTNCSVPLNVSVTEAVNGSELIGVADLAPSHSVQGFTKHPEILMLSHSVRFIFVYSASVTIMIVSRQPEPDP